MAETVTYPVRQLREQATALEAAMTVCLAKPDKKAVHKLRAQTRRVEAQLLLLKQMRELPPYRSAAADLQQELQKLRKSAGRVRDLDVHAQMLKEFAAADPKRPAKSGKRTPAKSAAKKSSKAAKALCEDAADLLAAEEKRRDQAATRLVKMIKKREARLAAALEALLHALKPADDPAISATDLLEMIERAAERAYGDPVDPERKRPRTDEQLHKLRKRSKLARYLAETAGSGSARARQLAKQSEALQDAGGAWHDLLDLAEEARDKLGRHHALTVELERRCQRHREGFLAALKRTA